MQQRIGVAVALLVLSQCASRAESLLDKRVGQFIFHGKYHKGSRAHMKATGPGGIEEAFRSLANHAEVPICIESLLPWGAGRPIIPIEIEAKDRTVGEILEEIVRQDWRYIYRERLGVIEVLPAHAEADPRNCLNMVIPKFMADSEWNSMFQSLQCQIGRVSRNEELLPNPARARGCPGGSFAGFAAKPPGIIVATFENERVRDILSKLCAMVGNMAWEAWFKGGPRSCEEMSVSPYRPREWYPPDAEAGGPLTYVERLPAQCVSCHYHRR